MDDEYKWAGVEDPKIMITTSRDPSSRLKMFAKVSGGLGDEMLPVISQTSSQDRDVCRFWGIQKQDDQRLAITVVDPLNDVCSKKGLQ